MGLNSDWPHQVDVLLVDDTGTGQRMGRAQTKYLVSPAVRCRVNELGPHQAMIADREEARHSHRVHFPDDPKLTTLHQLAWTRSEDGFLAYLQVRGLERSPDGGRWLPWVAFCELDESAEPPLTSTSGLEVYNP